MNDETFDRRGIDRQLLIWALATRRQLERWEPLVAANLRAQSSGPPFSDVLIWQAATEHHFLLIAARRLITAIEMSKGIPIDRTIREELKEGRDLHEHWKDNAPVFMVTPRRAEPPRKSGKSFAARNPKRGPYWWLGWNNQDGPMILPNVPAHAVHELVDRVEAAVIKREPSFARFPTPQPSPWLGEQYGKDLWWPALEGNSES